MNDNNTNFVENNENEIDKHKKFLQYRKEWVKNNKDKVNSYARAQYLRNLNIHGDQYRDKLNLKNKEARKLLKEQRILQNPDLIIKIGRPKKAIPDVILSFHLNLAFVVFHSFFFQL